MVRHQVAITGFGIVAGLGVGVPEFRERMFAGASGISGIRGTLVAENFPIAVAATVPESQLRPSSILPHVPGRALPKSWRFAGLATEEALTSLPPGVRVDAIVYAGSDGVNFNLLKDSFRGSLAECFEWDLLRSEFVLELIREALDKRGHGWIPDGAVISMNNGCVSSNQTIGIAFDRIRSGQWTRAVVGGVDARCDDYNLMNFHLLGALTTLEGPSASRPFSNDRSGFVRGEGAATLILESRKAAEERQAEVLGFVTGVCATSDAYRLTDGRPDGKAAVRAIVGALKDAGCSSDAVNAISAHGTSTRMNDSLETAVIKEAFGSRAYQIPVISLKSQVGHTTVAAGAMEAVASLLMLSEQKLAPTIGYTQADPECDLDYVPNCSRSACLEVILSNNFGFGGQNACVVFQRSSG
jgi:3-oxoacyl-[acyl-carrier-protein] synthase II